MKTDDITIGRNPGLTYHVLAAVARRAEQESARKRRRQRLAEALTHPLRWVTITRQPQH